MLSSGLDQAGVDRMGVPKLLVVGFYCHLVEVDLIDSLSSVAQIAILNARKGLGFCLSGSSRSESQQEKGKTHGCY